METKPIIAALALKLKKKQILKNVSMKLHTTFKVGGAAKIMALPETEEEIQYCIECCKALDAPYYIIGRGSNLLVLDAGYDGVVIKLGEGFGRIEVDGEIVTAQAGALLSNVAKAAADHNLAGMEGGSGIPGSIGGGVVMNAGAYGWEMKDSIMGATGITPEGKIISLTKEDLKLTYRHSALQDNGIIITSVRLKLHLGDAAKIKANMSSLKKQRNDHQPVTFPNAGSIFKRSGVSFTAKLIEEAGLKGLALGGAVVSPLHAGFIINSDHASAEDILNLIKIIKLTVYDHSGVKLEEEIKILG